MARKQSLKKLSKFTFSCACHVHDCGQVSIICMCMNLWTVMLEFPFQNVLCFVLSSNTVGIFLLLWIFIDKGT